MDKLCSDSPAEVWLASPGIPSTSKAFILPTPSYSCFKTQLRLPLTIHQAHANDNAPAGQSGSSSELHL